METCTWSTMKIVDTPSMQKRDIRQLDDDDDKEHRRDPRIPLDVDPDRGAGTCPPSGPEASLAHFTIVELLGVLVLLADDCLQRLHMQKAPEHQGLEVIIDALEREEQQTADEHHERSSDEQEAGPDLAGAP